MRASCTVLVAVLAVAGAAPPAQTEFHLRYGERPKRSRTAGESRPATTAAG